VSATWNDSRSGYQVHQVHASTNHATFSVREKVPAQSMKARNMQLISDSETLSQRPAKAVGPQMVWYSII